MKKKTIKKMALGLAATSIITLTSGCSKKDVSIPKTASTVSEDLDNIYEDYTWYTGDTIVFKGQEYKEAHNPSSEYVVNEYTGISYENGLSTDSLFFIRIDGKVYLATKLTDINEDNIISKYYAVDTGEFLGQTLDVNWYARATKDIEAIIPPKITKTEEHQVSVNDNLNDKNYFNGQYGLGKNISRENIISATSLFTEKKLTKEQIDNLIEDSLLTASIVEKYCYSSLVDYPREDYTFIPLKYIGGDYTAGFNGKISYYFNYMWQFEIKDDNNIRKIVGYRASTNKNDYGYNYIYDIVSSSYIDISSFEILSAKTMIGSNTIGTLRKQLDSALYYSIDNLKVVSTSNLEGEGAFEKYYISTRRENIMGNTYRYEVLGETEAVALSGSYDGTQLCIVKDGFLKITSLGADDGIMVSLQECLEMNGLSNYIKETYTEEELSTLLIKLRNKELDLAEPHNETREADRKVNIKDIIVVDTTKESGDSVLVASEKKYYVLIPFEMSESIKTANPETSYYETCDHKALGAISFERGYVRIDNFGKTFYYLYKIDGELECVSTFEELLREIGLEDCIREEYALIDLQILTNKINEKQKVLSFVSQ